MGREHGMQLNNHREKNENYFAETSILDIKRMAYISTNLDGLLSFLKADLETSKIKEEKNKALIKEEVTRPLPNLLENFVLTSSDERRLVAALCPNCKNVDCRFHDKRYEKQSTIVPGSEMNNGVMMECLCCSTKFLHSWHTGFMGEITLKNHVSIPVEFMEKVLKITL